MPEIGAPHKTTHENGGNDEISVAGLSGALADAQTPAAHKTSHQDGGTDEISVAGLVGREILVPYNAKIADIKETDTSAHYLDLATALSETRTIISVILSCARISGSGNFYVYPNEGSSPAWLNLSGGMPNPIVIKSGTNRLMYNQSVANDDFDLYGNGYVVVTA